MSGRSVYDSEHLAGQYVARLPAGPVRDALADLVDDVKLTAEWTFDAAAMAALDAVPAVVRAILGES